MYRELELIECDVRVEKDAISNETKKTKAKKVWRKNKSRCRINTEGHEEDLEPS